MNTHLLAGVVVAVVLLATFAMLFESDIRARLEKAGQRKRRRQRTKERASRKK